MQVSDCYDMLINYLRKSNFEIIFSEESEKIANGESFFCPSEKKVKIPSKNVVCKSGEMYFLSTAIHECVHSTMIFLNREPENSSEGYAYEEMVAEIGATVMLKQIVFPTNVEKILALKNATYVSCFNKNVAELEQIPKLRKALNEAKKAVEYILKVGGNN